MTKKFDYAAKKAELETLLAWFDSPDATLGDSMEQFDRAKELLDELSAFLDDMQAKLEVKVQSLQSSAE